MEKQFPKTCKLECSLNQIEYDQFERFRKERGAKTKAEIMRMALKSYMGKWTERKEKHVNYLNLEKRISTLERRFRE